VIFDSPGRFFLSRTHKTTVHTAASLHCSCPANRNKGNLLLAPATLSIQSAKREKNWGFSYFIGDFSMEMPPLIEKLTAMDVRSILDFQIEVQTIIRFSSVLTHEKHCGFASWPGHVAPKTCRNGQRHSSKKGETRKKREQSVRALLFVV